MPTTVLNCQAGTLAPWTPDSQQPWDERRARHLLRRLGFGASREQVAEALAHDPLDYVDQLIDQAVALPLPDPPAWVDWNEDDYANNGIDPFEHFLEWTLQWIKDMLQHGLREKVALFWHNHFVTIHETYGCPQYQYLYHRLLQQYAFGNFKEFLKEIGKTPAMLMFLNGVQSTKWSPNENYARELYELFTLGADNGYTQQDIVETARALTGWNGIDVYCEPITFVPMYHDDGPKTIFGQTGNWGYDDVHDILFAQRGQQVAQHICRKIYRYFVHPEPDEAIVSGLAATFLANDFELEPVFRQLFKSEHFFHDSIIGTRVKDPIECLLTFPLEAEFPIDDDWVEAIWYFAGLLGQNLFNPVDVAGWPGDRTWINSSTLTGRWQVCDYYLYWLVDNHLETLRQFAINLVGGNTNDPVLVTQRMLEHFLPQGPASQAALDQAVSVFKWEVPENYYTLGLWNLDWDSVPWQVALLLQHIARQPEFQLS